MAGSSCRAHLIGILSRSASPDPAAAADQLLAEWPTLPQVLAARTARLLTVSCGDQSAVDAIVGFRRAMRHALRVRMAERPLLDSNRKLFSYLKACLAHRTSEESRVLYLTTDNCLIRDEVAALGTIDESAVYPREIIHRALDLAAAGLVLVHNHPSGNCLPSQSDVEFTKRLANLAAPLRLAVLDHVVVGRDGCTSMRTAGLLA